MAEKKSLPAVITDLGEKIGGARKDMAVSTGPRKARISNDDRPAWSRRFVVMEQLDRVTKKGTGKWSLVDMGKNERWGGRALMRDLPSKEAAEQAVPMAAVSRNHRVRAAADGKFEIWRSVTDRKNVRVVQQQFDSRDAAMEHMARNAVKIIETKTSFGEEILAKPETVYRQGPAVRPGDIAGEAFMKTLGMRGVEFGNWQGERQSVMNHAYDAMRDLADVTGIDPKDVSLKGDLALAFGARGKGGLQAARAHYEAKYAAINLTKLEGAGALAHEWWHGVDHMLARMDDPRLSELDPKSPTKAFKSHLGNGIFGSARVASRQPGKLPDPVRAAYKELVDAIYRKPEQYVEDKAKAEKFTEASRKGVQERLDSIRKDLASKLSYGKRNVDPATPEQLARFDAAAERILSGDVKTEWKHFETKPSAWNPSGGSTSRWTAEPVEEINAVMKEVRGRTGFGGSKGAGTLDYLVGAMKTHAGRLEMLKDAAAESTKTKFVPTEYAMQARKLDEGRVQDYWQTHEEMTARAFSAYIEDKLAAQGRRSDYLSYGSDNRMYEWLGMKPFPDAGEREVINAKFDKLFAAMKEAEVVRAAEPTAENMAAALTRANARAAEETKIGKAPAGWSDEARAASAEARAANAQWNSAQGTRKVVGETMVAGEKRLMVQTGDSNQHELLRPSELERQIKIDEARASSRAQAATKAAAEAEAAQTAAKQKADIDGFKQDADAIARGKAAETLDRKVSTSGGAKSRKELVREKVSSGAKVETVKGQRRLVNNDGTFVDEKQISKTAMDYAEHLISKSGRPAGDNGAPPDAQLKAAKRLEEVAKRTIEEAQRVHDQPRLMNTARRARMGSGVMEEQQRKIANAKTALRIAEALRDGTASPELAKVQSLADVERLTTAYRQALYNNKAKREQHRGSMIGIEPDASDIAHAQASAWVRAYVNRYDVEKLQTLLKGKGVARDLARLEAIANRPDSWAHHDLKDIEAIAKVAKAIKAKVPPPKNSWDKEGRAARDAHSMANRWLGELKEYEASKRLGLADNTSLRSMLTAYAEMRVNRPKADPVAALERDLIGTKIPGFFPTPQSLAARMADLADIKPGMTVLEPSAGTGRLADAAKQRGAKVEAIEVAPRLAEILKQKGHAIIGSDFNEVPIAQRYDRIMMNPPFEKGQDMAHVRRAYDMLKPGGKMVAIMGEGAFFRSDKQAAGFREWLGEVGGAAEKLPEGTFKESNTGVNTRLVTITKPGVNPGWSDAARIASAEARGTALPGESKPVAEKPMSAAMRRALETSEQRAVPTPQSTLTSPEPTAAPPVTKEQFMAEAEVRKHPDGGHEVRGPGTNGQWVRTNATGTTTAAKLIAFKNHVYSASNKLGAIAMIAAPITAAALAYDATKNQAAADGLSPTKQTTDALTAAAVAGGVTAGIGYGISKGFGLAAKVAPKLIGRALPGVGVALMAYGAVQGYKHHGLKGAALGLVGADGLLDVGKQPAALPAPTSPADAATKFEVANDAFNAMQETAAADRVLRGFQNPENLSAALAAQGKKLGAPVHGQL